MKSPVQGCPDHFKYVLYLFVHVLMVKNKIKSPKLTLCFVYQVDIVIW